MLDGVNVLDTVGRLGLTVSVSTAEHIPDIQNVDVLVLVKPLGGAIVAVLVTEVCARAVWATKKHSTTPNATIDALETRPIRDHKKVARSKTPSLANG
jgi:hypothetical protein